LEKKSCKSDPNYNLLEELKGRFAFFFFWSSCRIPVSVVHMSTTWILYQIRKSPAQFYPTNHVSYCPLCGDQIVVCFAFLATLCERSCGYFSLLDWV